MRRSPSLVNLPRQRPTRPVDDLVGRVRYALAQPGPHFIWASVEPGRTVALARPYDELENKYHFVRHVEETAGVSILKPPSLGSSARRT